MARENTPATPEHRGGTIAMLTGPIPKPIDSNWPVPLISQQIMGSGDGAG